jgi:hypothetical protein
MCDVYGEAPFGTYFASRDKILESRSEHYTQIKRPLTNFATRQGEDPVVFARRFWSVRETDI